MAIKDCHTCCANGVLCDMRGPLWVRSWRRFVTRLDYACGVKWLYSTSLFQTDGTRVESRIIQTRDIAVYWCRVRYRFFRKPWRPRYVTDLSTLYSLPVTDRWEQVADIRWCTRSMICSSNLNCVASGSKKRKIICASAMGSCIKTMSIAACLVLLPSRALPMRRPGGITSHLPLLVREVSRPILIIGRIGICYCREKIIHYLGLFRR